MLAVCALSASTRALGQSQTQYGIRENESRLGTNIKLYAAGPVRYPINKRYSEFTAEERASFNEYYEAMAESDEPPFPKEGMHEMLSYLTKAQAKLLVTGPLHLVAAVDSVGKVQSVRSVGSPGKSMTSFATQLLLLTAFKPALCKGVACAMEFPLYIEFKVR